jgi:pyruvate dehydrogenase E1 component
VPIVPDESRTFGMEGMFRQPASIRRWAPLPQDADQLMYYREDKSGQVLQEGINEAGAMSSWIAAATSYSTNNVPMILFCIWLLDVRPAARRRSRVAAGDALARLLMGGNTDDDAERRRPAARGRAQPRAGVDDPNCISYDPTFAYEVVVIVRAASAACLMRSGRLLLHHADERELSAPGDGRRGRGHRQGLYMLKEGPRARHRVQLMGSGTILREVIAAADLLRDDWKVNADL